MGITITSVASARRLLMPLDPLDSGDEALFGCPSVHHRFCASSAN
jgi:hypothetical protein